MNAKKIAELVDQLGLVKAQAAKVSEEENKLKQQLIEAGVTEADGEFYRATVSEAERNTRDDAFKAFIETLVEKHTTPQYRRAHTKTSITTSVRVVARVQQQRAG